MRRTSGGRFGFEFVGLTPDEPLQITNVMGQS